MNVKVAIVDHVGLKAGMDLYDLALYKSLRQLGCESFIYSNFDSAEKGIFKRFRFRVSENLFSFFLMTFKYRKISHDISRRGISHCIVHGFRFGLPEWLLVNILKRSSIKIYMIVHDPESLLETGKSSKWKKKIFELCEAIIVHNAFSADELSKEFNDFEKSKVAVIPHGHFIDTAVVPADSERFKAKYNLDKKSKHILFFGQIKKSKGLALLLEALPVTDSAICVIIAGRMRKHNFDEYQDLIDRNNLGSRIKIFPGYITPEMRNELFHLSDAVVVPYTKVFQSGVLLMAMSYGKAVIASDLPPNREIITDKENGFLFQSGNKESLAVSINNVMSDDAKRAEVAMNGKVAVESRHQWNSIADQWIKLFQQ